MLCRNCEIDRYDLPEPGAPPGRRRNRTCPQFHQFRPSPRPEPRRSRAATCVDRAHAVDLDQLSLRHVVGQQRRGLRVVGGEPDLERLGIVVRAALIGEALGDARRAGPRRRPSAAAPGRCACPWRVSMSSSASAWATVRGKPSKIAPPAASAAGSASSISAMTISSDTSSPRVHDALDAPAERRAGRDRRAQHVAGGELDHAARLDQTLGLGALARRRRAEQDQVHRPPYGISVGCGLLALGAAQFRFADQPFILVGEQV